MRNYGDKICGRWLSLGHALKTVRRVICLHFRFNYNQQDKYIRLLPIMCAKLNKKTSEILINDWSFVGAKCGSSSTKHDPRMKKKTYMRTIIFC